MKNTSQNSSITNRKLLSLSLAALLSSGSFYSASAAEHMAQKPVTASPASQTKQAQNINADYLGWYIPAMQKVAVFSGQALLRHLSAASKALENKNIDKAKISLTAANDFAESLKKMIPFTRITDEVKDSNGNILQIKEGYLLDDLLPVYENIEQLDFYAPELTEKVSIKHGHKQQTRAQEKQKKSSAKKADNKAEELFEASDTTVYLPVLNVDGLINNALSAVTRKNPDINTAKVAVKKALNSLTAVVAREDFLQTPKTAKQKTQTEKKETSLIRSELIRVKQSIAFAENLQKEARHDPQYIYASVDDAITIVDKLLSSSSLKSETRTKLEVIKKAIQKIKTNVNDTAAYSEVRSLLEPLTDNPGE